jgi:hypothetical protein
MTVDNPQVVDVIATVRDTGEVLLTISDHLEWDDPTHLIALEAKLKAYVAFIESGDIYEQYPLARGASLRIDVCCKYSPSTSGESYLTNAREIIAKAGYGLSWRVLAA